MGSNDVPPPHVSPLYLPITNTLLQVGGSLWTLCYILLARESLLTKTYGMPLFALSFNFAWELIYAFYVAEAPLERGVFAIWCLLDLLMVYALVRHGHNEWRHAPLIARHIGKVFWILTAWCCVGHWASASWWIAQEMGRKEGKYYFGRVGADTTELGFWSAGVSQAYLSAASLGQLVVRRHTGGVSWGIWVTRASGSLIGLYLNYGAMWYMWREAHEYFMSPFGIFLWGTALVCDLIYPFVFAEIRKTEEVLPDGRKVAGGNKIHANGKKAL
ncbi:Terpene cyclase andB [Lachnellula arida]|uniref:Terpene cyclase andB n=1 Tax=Lachnellula arida TaxID=1316785 RepID=A0A8T9BF66_9HELO|nr:Terpene cyclase andB [Lachnellula arida]